MRPSERARGAERRARPERRGETPAARAAALVLLIVGLAASGCYLHHDPSRAGADAGRLDAGRLDAGRLDAGCEGSRCRDAGIDAGVDARVPTDAGCVTCPPLADGCVYRGGDCARCGEVRCGCAGGCGDDEYCAFPENLCGRPTDSRPGPGECAPRPEACVDVVDPVCGCDGRTYENACVAFRAGTDVDHAGPCAPGACAPMDARGVGDCERALGLVWDGVECALLVGCECVGADCGRVASNTCGRDMAHCTRSFRCTSSFTCEAPFVCALPESTECGAAEPTGTCLPDPESWCSDEGPVCGCDGFTYASECEALIAGLTSVASDGPCEPPDDCRTEGCSDGARCMACLTASGPIWICLTDPC